MALGGAVNPDYERTALRPKGLKVRFRRVHMVTSPGGAVRMWAIERLPSYFAAQVAGTAAGAFQAPAPSRGSMVRIWLGEINGRNSSDRFVPWSSFWWLRYANPAA